jgi:hypothetical protein
MDCLDIATDSLLVIRVIKNFHYRTIKDLILPHVDLTVTTVGQLMEQIKERMPSRHLSECRDTEASWVQTIQKRGL